jgi:hypothetical protein
MWRVLPKTAGLDDSKTLTRSEITLLRKQDETSEILVGDNMMSGYMTSKPHLFDKIITSSIKNPIAVVIIPYIAKNIAGGGVTAALPFGQYESPYDTAPSTGAPLSLTNISVTLGGIKVANEVLNYTYENFLQQV